MIYTNFALKNKHLAVAVTILTILGGQASATTFLTEKELLATIPGGTLYGVSAKDGKTKWIQNYGKGRRKGKIAGLWNEKDQYKSKWFVKDGQWCEDWGDGNGCWYLELVKPNKLRVYEDGKPRKYLWTIK